MAPCGQGRQEQPGTHTSLQPMGLQAQGQGPAWDEEHSTGAGRWGEVGRVRSMAGISLRAFSSFNDSTISH